MKNGLMIDSDGTQRWYLDDQLHRDEDDLPAVIHADATQWYHEGYHEWFRHGLRHRDNNPAVITAHGLQRWYHYGRRHRENGPATIWAFGMQMWYLNDKEIDVEKWIKDNNLPSWETWDTVTWSLFRLEFLFRW